MFSDVSCVDAGNEYVQPQRRILHKKYTYGQVQRSGLLHPGQDMGKFIRCMVLVLRWLIIMINPIGNTI